MATDTRSKSSKLAIVEIFCWSVWATLNASTKSTDAEGLAQSVRAQRQTRYWPTSVWVGSRSSPDRWPPPAAAAYVAPSLECVGGVCEAEPVRRGALVKRRAPAHAPPGTRRLPVGSPWTPLAETSPLATLRLDARPLVLSRSEGRAGFCQCHRGQPGSAAACDQAARPEHRFALDARRTC
jgi:hypothetical protein